MILASLTIVLSGGAPLLSAPWEASSPPPETCSEASLTVRVEETRFTAVNTSIEPLLLAFACGRHEPELVFWLPPHGRVESAFPSGSMSDVQIEVVQRSSNGWTSSGAWELSLPTFARARDAWAFPSGVVLAASEGEPIAREIPFGSLLPAHLAPFVSAPGSESDSSLPSAAPLHVPIPPPSEKPAGDKPPKLEDRPLPPV